MWVTLRKDTHKQMTATMTPLLLSVCGAPTSTPNPHPHLYFTQKIWGTIIPYPTHPKLSTDALVALQFTLAYHWFSRGRKVQTLEFNLGGEYRGQGSIPQSATSGGPDGGAPNEPLDRWGKKILPLYFNFIWSISHYISSGKRFWAVVPCQIR